MSANPISVQLLNIMDQLPAERQAEVLDFALFLRQRSGQGNGQAIQMLNGRLAVADLPLRLYLPAMSDDEFFDFCQANRDLRIERTAQGEIIIMPPAGGETSNRNAALTTLLTTWAWRDGTGRSFDSSGGFILPNGATRSPDAAWVRSARLASLTPAQWRKFLPLCPDFVVELMSPSDNLAEAQAKMEEYLANGAMLGWLLDAEPKTAYVYHPGQPVEILQQPTVLSGEPVLPGFTLELSYIWPA